MASMQMLMAAAAAMIAVVFLPALASATDHVVGDASGWTLGFDYMAWAQSKQFRVGDTIAFKYSPSSHNVAELSGPDFKACNRGAATSMWSTGDDRVTLDKPGRRWFICAVGQHCENGMKLNITVLAAGTPAAAVAAPAPAPGPEASGRAARRFPTGTTEAAAPAPAPMASDRAARRFLSKWW